MNYEKKYKEALERARTYHKNTCLRNTLEALENIFPELKESEDERIRKEIISALKYANCKGVYDKHIAWLEKQGEQKSYDEVKPKFHEGEWITNGNYTWKIVEVKPLVYILQSQDGNIVDDTIFHVDEQFHYFTIQDAKEGDVLVASDGSLFMFAKLKNNSAYYHISLCKNGNMEISDGNHSWETAKGCHPATKEQRELLFSKMHEAGYEWDVERKKLKNIDAKENLTLDGDLMEADCMIAEQKPAWSEEDETYLDHIITSVKLYYTDDKGKENPWRNELLRRLKSLRLQNKWKPSEEQMKALHDLNLTGNISYAGQGQTLIELYNDLKKITE